MAMDELKYKDGKFTVNGADVSNVSATTEINESVQEISANTSQFSVIVNPEFIEVKTDLDNKIVEAINVEGVNKHFIPNKFSEIILNDDTTISGSDDLNEITRNDLINNHLGDLSAALMASGISATKYDFTNASEIALPIPEHCATVKINGEIPTSKYFNKNGTIEYFDEYGNYFKKYIQWSIQGRLSATFDKKNWSIDIYNDDPNSMDFNEDSCKIRFGNWVSQDSFHLKGFALDFNKIRCIAPYRHAEEISQSREASNRRPWQKYLEGWVDPLTKNPLTGGTGNFDDDIPTEMFTRPDGFPFLLYINNIPWGLYFWQLKKSKENQNIVKNDDEGKQIYIGGDMCYGFYDRYLYNLWELTKEYVTDTDLNTYPLWSADNDYNVGDIVIDTETFDFESSGITQSVTIKRLFTCKLANGPQTVMQKDYEYLSTKPSQLHWKSIEVRNPKKTICREIDGVDESGNTLYRYEYYNFDSPKDYVAGVPIEKTHEMISSAMVSESEITKLKATGESKNFTKKEYQRSIKTRKSIDEYSKCIPVIENIGHGIDYSLWGYSNELEAKRAIFAEHNDIDFNLDFFIVWQDTYWADSIINNTLFTMYDGKHLIGNVYDTDATFEGIGGGGKVTSLRPNVSPWLNKYLWDHTFVYYLWELYPNEIKERWAELRKNGVISGDRMASIIDVLTDSIGIGAYKEELRLWDNMSYRKPVYWYMPSGSIIHDKEKGHYYDESINKENTSYSAWTETEHYVVGDKRNYKGHSYICTIEHDGAKVTPDKGYTCGFPYYGGVFDTIARHKAWFTKRIENLDKLFGYNN